MTRSQAILDLIRLTGVELPGAVLPETAGCECRCEDGHEDRRGDGEIDSDCFTLLVIPLVLLDHGEKVE